MRNRSINGLLLMSGFLLVVLGAYTVYRLKILGAFIEVQNTFKGHCTVVAEVPGPESIQLDPEADIVYFISNNPCTTTPSRGSIYSLRLGSSEKGARPLSFDKPLDFQPHGLSFFRDKRGLRYLFTNNHRKDGGHTVEIFQILPANSLKHKATISGKQLTSPNDLVAVGPRQFYLTNDGRSHDRATRSLDTFLGRKTGYVLYFDGSRFTKVVDNLQFPNGIVIDTMTNQLIVAETLSGRILCYQIENGLLSNVDNFYIKEGLDNLSIDSKGQLLAAVHPNLLSLSRHLRNTGKRSPSQIFRYNFQTKGLKRIYQQEGNTLSGISAAIMVDRDLYLGAVCDSKLLKCTLQEY